MAFLPQATGSKRPTDRVSPGDWFVQRSLYDRLKSAGEMGSLAVRTVRIAVRPPFTWWRPATEEAAIGIRRSLIPMTIAHACYLIGFGTILFGVVLHNIGVIERQAGAMYVFWARELGTWITSMVFAGVVGSAIAADLGSRKIREELDAMAVLGVEQLRLLVVPRVMMTTIVAPALAFISLFAVTAINYFVGPRLLGYSTGVFRDNVMRSIIPMDLIFPMLVKNAVIGFLVGIIACHKGLTCRLGADGVGRAVKETVVISFLTIWTFNSFFNLAYLSLYPGGAVVRG